MGARERFFHNGGRLTTLLWVALAVAVIWGALATFSPWGSGNGAALSVDTPFAVVTEVVTTTQFTYIAEFCNNTDRDLDVTFSSSWARDDLTAFIPSTGGEVVLEPGCMVNVVSVPFPFDADNGTWYRTGTGSYLDEDGIRRDVIWRTDVFEVIR